MFLFSIFLATGKSCGNIPNDMWGIVRKVFTSCMQIVLMDKWGSTIFPYLFVNFANCANIAQMGVIPICVVVCKLQSVLKQAFAIPKNVLFWLMWRGTKGARETGNTFP